MPIPNEASQNILAAREQYKTELAKTAPQHINQAQAAFSQGLGANLAAGISYRQQVRDEKERYRREVTAAKDIFETSVAKGAPEYGVPEYVEKEYSAITSKLQTQVDRLDKRIAEVKAQTSDSSISPQMRKNLNDQLDILQSERDAYAQGLSMDKYEAIRYGQGDYFTELAQSKSNYELAKQKALLENEKAKADIDTKQREIELKYPGTTDRTPAATTTLYNNVYINDLNDRVARFEKSGTLTPDIYNKLIKETQEYVKDYAGERGHNISFPSIPTGTTTFKGSEKTTIIEIPAEVTSDFTFSNKYKSGQLAETRLDIGPTFQKYSTGAIQYLDLGSSKVTPIQIVQPQLENPSIKNVISTFSPFRKENGTGGGGGGGRAGELPTQFGGGSFGGAGGGTIVNMQPREYGKYVGQYPIQDIDLSKIKTEPSGIVPTVKEYDTKTGQWIEKPYTGTVIDLNPKTYTLSKDVQKYLPQEYKEPTFREFIGTTAQMFEPLKLATTNLPPEIWKDYLNKFYLDPSFQLELYREIKSQEEMQRNLKIINPRLEYVTTNLKQLTDVLKPYNEKQELLNKNIQDVQKKYEEGKVTQEELISSQNQYEIATALNLQKYNQYKPDLEKLQQEQEKLVNNPSYQKALELQNQGKTPLGEYAKLTSGGKTFAVSAALGALEAGSFFIAPVRVVKAVDIGTTGFEKLGRQEYLGGALDIGMSALLLGAPALLKTGAKVVQPVSTFWKSAGIVGGTGLALGISGVQAIQVAQKTGSAAAAYGAGTGYFLGLVGPPIFKMETQRLIEREKVKAISPLEGYQGEKGIVKGYSPSGKEPTITFLEQTPKGVTITQESALGKPLTYSSGVGKGTSYQIGTATMTGEETEGVRVLQFYKWQRDIEKLSKFFGFSFEPKPIGFGETGTTNLILYPGGKYTSTSGLKEVSMSAEEGLKQYNIMFKALVKRGYTAVEAETALKEVVPKFSLLLTRTGLGGQLIERYGQEANKLVQIPGYREGVMKTGEKPFTTDRTTLWRDVQQYKIDLARPTELFRYTGDITSGGVTKGAVLKGEKVGELLTQFWKTPQEVLTGKGLLLGEISPTTGLLKGVTRLGNIQATSVQIPVSDILNDFKLMQQLKKDEPGIDARLKSGIGKPQVWRTREYTTDPTTGKLTSIKNKYEIIVLDKQELRAEQITKGVGTKAGGEEYRSYVLTKQRGADGRLVSEIQTIAGPKIKSGTLGEKALDELSYQKYIDYNRQLSIEVEETPTGRFKKLISISENPVVQEYPPWTKLEQVRYGFPKEGTSREFIQQLRLKYNVPDIYRAKEPPTMLFGGRQLNPDAVVLEKAEINKMTLQKYLRTEEPITTVKDIEGSLKGIKNVNVISKDGTIERFNVIREAGPEKPLATIVSPKINELGAYKFTTKEDAGKIIKFVSTEGRTVYPNEFAEFKVTKVNPLSSVSEVTVVPKADIKNANVIKKIVEEVITRKTPYMVGGEGINVGYDTSRDIGKYAGGEYTSFTRKGNIGQSLIMGGKEEPIIDFGKTETKKIFSGGVTIVPTIFPSVETITKITEVPAKAISLDLSKVFVPTSSYEKIFTTGTAVLSPTSVPIMTLTPVNIPAVTNVPTTTITPVPTTTTVPTTVPVEVPVQVPVQVPIQVPVQVPIQVPVTVPVTVPVPVPALTPGYIPGYQPPVQLIGGAFAWFPGRRKGEPKKKKEKPKKGYEVEIRRRRKFQPTTKFAFATKEEAIQFGAKRTLETAAATFRIKPSAKPVREEVAIPKINIKQFFRAPKRKEAPETYVQFGKKRITTAGEKKEISYAGIAARTGRPAPKIKPTSFLKSKSSSKSMRGTFFKK